jgi:hypothetical protein
MPHTGTSVILWALINLTNIAAVRVYEAYSAIIIKVYRKHGVVVQGRLEQGNKVFVEVYRNIRMI